MRKNKRTSSAEPARLKVGEFDITIDQNGNVREPHQWSGILIRAKELDALAALKVVKRTAKVEQRLLAAVFVAQDALDKYRSGSDFHFKDGRGCVAELQVVGDILHVGCSEVPLKAVKRVHRLSMAIRARRKARE